MDYVYVACCFTCVDHYCIKLYKSEPTDIDLIGYFCRDVVNSKYVYITRVPFDMLFNDELSELFEDRWYSYVANINEHRSD